MTLLYICLGVSVATAAWLGYVNYRLSKSRERLINRFKSMDLSDEKIFVREVDGAFEVCIRKPKQYVVLRRYSYGDLNDKAYKWLHVHEVCDKFNDRP